MPTACGANRVLAVYITGRPPLGTAGLKVEHLNDANAIFEYKGIYHVMNQGGFNDPDPDHKFKGVVNWTHAVR